MAMTFEYDEGWDRRGVATGVRKVTATWTSDAAGAATGTTGKLVGRIIKATTIPSGTAAPTDDYDITLTDDAGVNLLAACTDNLADRDTANAEEVYFLIASHDMTPISTARSPFICGALTITVAAAGNTKSGTIVLFLE